MSKKKQLKKTLAATLRELDRIRLELEYTDQAKEHALERAAVEFRNNNIASHLIAALNAEIDRLDPERSKVDPIALDWEALSKVLKEAETPLPAEA